MPDFPSFPDLFRVARDEALAKNSNLTREVIERQGTDANSLIAADATVGDEVVGQLAKVDAAQFLDSAKKEALTRLVYDRYNMARKPASAARGSVVFSTTAPNPTSFAIPVGTRLQTSDGRQFVTITNTTFQAGITGPVPVPVRSVLAGISQQAKANTITNIIDVPAGSPADLRVVNTLATAGADDEEADEDLALRARNFFTNARRGTLTAIAQAALAVAGVRRAEAFEAIDSGGRPARYVELVISDAFTEVLVNANPTPPAYEAQSQVLAQEVSTSLDEARAAGIYVRALVALTTLLSVQLSLTFATGIDTDLAAFRARAVIVGYINGLNPGQPFVYADAIELLKGVAGLVVNGAEIASPPGNVQPNVLEVLRSSLNLVAAVSLQPDQKLQGSTTNT